MSHQLVRKGKSTAIVTVGIDLAKNVFAVHGVDATGKPILIRPSVPRGKLLELIASLPPCLIGMEACSGAHHWARLFADFGHTVRLMAPKFVVPYRLSGKAGKNDAADAAAICEAVTRPNASGSQPSRPSANSRRDDASRLPMRNPVIDTHAVTSRSPNAGAHNVPPACAMGAVLPGNAGPSSPWHTTWMPM
jgi:hypothetical protein